MRTVRFAPIADIPSYLSQGGLGLWISIGDAVEIAHASSSFLTGEAIHNLVAPARLNDGQARHQCVEPRGNQPRKYVNTVYRTCAWLDVSY